MQVILNQNKPGEEQIVTLRSEKKSVYWLDPTPPVYEQYQLPSPASCLLTRKTPKQYFYFGGFQVLNLSQCKSIDVYLASASASSTIPSSPKAGSNKNKPSMEHLMTVRTVQGKAMCVVPGGPRPVAAVQLKFNVKSSTATIPIDDNNDTQQQQQLVPPPPQQEPIIAFESIRWTLRTNEETATTPGTGTAAAVDKAPVSPIRQSKMITKKTPKTPTNPSTPSSSPYKYKQQPMSTSSLPATLPIPSSPYNTTNTSDSYNNNNNSNISILLKQHEEHIIHQMNIQFQSLASIMYQLNGTVTTQQNLLHQLLDENIQLKQQINNLQQQITNNNNNSYDSSSENGNQQQQQQQQQQTGSNNNNKKGKQEQQPNEKIPTTKTMGTLDTTETMSTVKVSNIDNDNGNEQQQTTGTMKNNNSNTGSNKKKQEENKKSGKSKESSSHYRPISKQAAEL